MLCAERGFSLETRCAWSGSATRGRRADDNDVSRCLEDGNAGVAPLQDLSGVLHPTRARQLQNPNVSVVGSHLQPSSKGSADGPTRATPNLLQSELAIKTKLCSSRNSCCPVPVRCDFLEGRKPSFAGSRARWPWCRCPTLWTSRKVESLGWWKGLGAWPPNILLRLGR